MATKQCKGENCGAVLPLAKFRSKGKMTDLCPTCRNRVRSREYQRRKQREKQEELAKRHVRAAVTKQRHLLNDAYIKGVLKEIKRLQAQPKQRIRIHQDNLASGAATERTMDNLKWQKQKLAFYEDVERIMRKDIKHDNLRPVDFYLANTWLLSKHGFPVVVVDDNPEIDYD